jgi:hypothetical protein
MGKEINSHENATMFEVTHCLSSKAKAEASQA